MEDSIRVHVVDKGRRNLYMRYRCPVTGRDETRSTGTAKPKEAAKVAAKWEAELQEGRYQRTSRMGWDEFKLAWEDAHLARMRPATLADYSSTFNAFKRHCRPARIGDLTTSRVTAFASLLRKQKSGRGKNPDQPLSEASVGKHLRQLKAIARWARKQRLIPETPEFDMPSKRSTAKMKGRAITGEEFDRILEAVAKVVSDEAAESWKLLLRGMWTSGLRLGEALAMRWDHKPGGVSVRLDGEQSVLLFDADSQKSGKVQIVPLAPEAVALLEPQKQETGYVFTVGKLRGPGSIARDRNKVSKIIAKIGKKAGVVVDAEKEKTASAHDLRRSFGFRWSRRVMPPELKELMRHASIETTMTYYVGQNAEATSKALWRAVGDTLGDTPPKKKHTPQDSNLQPSDS